MQRLRFVQFVVLVACVLAYGTASARVMYTYSGGQNPGCGAGCIDGMTFQFIAATFLTPFTGYLPPFDQPQVPVSRFTSYTYPHPNYLGITFLTSPEDSIFTLPPPSDGIAFEEPGTEYFVYFPKGSLANYGVYSQVFFGQGTLTLSPTAIPEPSTLVLLATGAAGLLGAARGSLML